MIRNSILMFVLLTVPLYAGAQTVTPDTYDESVELLSAYIQQKSLTGEEGTAGLFLSNYCRENGLETIIYHNQDSSYNFAASLYPLSSEKPNIIFLNHIDVVPEGNISAWKHPPYSGAIEEGAVWGRGALDCKGVAVMQLMALKSFVETAKKEDLPYNVTLLCVSGEETGGRTGAKKVVEQHLGELNPAVVFGEGGSGIDDVVPSYPEQVVFGISVAEKQTLWLQLETEGRTYGHSAAPQALYANKKLVKVLIKIIERKHQPRFSKVSRKMFKELGRMERGIRGFVIRHINWWILWPFVKKYFSEGEPFHIFVHNTEVITAISNPKGTMNNQIADKAQAVLDCRLLPETDSEKFIKKIKAIAGPKVDVSVIFQSQGSPASLTDHFFDSFEQSVKKVFPGSEAVPFLFPAATDNNYFRQKGIPVFGLTPVMMSGELIKSVHNVDERIGIKDIHKGIDVYFDFLKTVQKF